MSNSHDAQRSKQAMQSERADSYQFPIGLVPGFEIRAEVRTD